MGCVYLSGEYNNRCLLHPGSGITCCNCKDGLAQDAPDLAAKFRDPLAVVRGSNRAPASDCLRGMLAGASVFYVCGGPSANDLPLEELNGKGIWSMAVNNAAAHPRFRPQAFVCADPPRKFSHSIWMDPEIMKFVPIPKLGGRRAKLREKRNGEFVPLDRDTSTAPNVWGFQRNPWLWPDDRFFASDGACWGNHDSGCRKTGQPKTVCTMLLGLRLLSFLGAGRVYLVGVDFRMTPDRGYSFGQGRDAGACASNNAQYVVVNRWLCELESSGVFRRFGLRVFNCYERSGLRAFPHVPFADALKDCRGVVEKSPDLAGWYDPEGKSQKIR